MSAEPTLLLFDIDGTLLAGATSAHRDALHAALLRVHGVDATSLSEPPSPAGRTDGEIARLILRSAGVDEATIDARAADVREECCRVYRSAEVGDLSHAVLPGINDLLASLSGREDLILALLTGNFEPVARRKLAAAEIGDFFADGQGAFGSDSEARVELPAVARRRAGNGGEPFARERTIVIGDTPRDIACARADGVRCVAVATGNFGVDALGDADWALSGAGELISRLDGMLRP